MFGPPSEKDGAGGRPAKLPALSSQSPPQQQPPRPFVSALPEAVCSHLLDFLPQFDVITLLAISKDVQQAVLLALRSWEVAADYRAAARFLEQARNLQRFHFFDVRLSMGSLSGTIQAIGDGSAGAQLRSLILTSLSSNLIRQLCTHLKAGRLPFLTALGLADERRDGHYRPHNRLSEEDDVGLVDTLEARGRLGLPPLTRIVGVDSLPSYTLRRLWACCPPEKIKYLEARGAEQVAALGQHLLEHVDFAALRSLRIVGDDSLGGSASRPAGLASIWRALEQGHAPGIEEIWLVNVPRSVGLIAPLGRLIGAGGLPKLAALTLACCETIDIRALIDGLRQAPNLRLRRLELEAVLLTEGEAGQLAAAIEAGGGLAHLEELLWPCDRDRGAWVLEALVGGAPCTRTLTKLCVGGYHITSAQARAFLLALGNGSFPRLRTLEMWVMDEGIMPALSQTLLRLVDGGVPSPLKKLTLTGHPTYDNEPLDLDALTPAFVGDGLPCLTHLTVKGLSEAPAASTFVQDWTALGRRIKLEQLGFVGFGDVMQERLAEAAADPAFCPSLRQIHVVRDDCSLPLYGERVLTGLRNRWRVRLGVPLEKAEV